MQDENDDLMFRPAIRDELYEMLDKQCKTCNDYESYANTLMAVAYLLASRAGKEPKMPYIKVGVIH